jgi:RNase P/RNase MRP subunit POP5
MAVKSKQGIKVCIDPGCVTDRDIYVAFNTHDNETISGKLITKECWFALSQYFWDLHYNQIANEVREEISGKDEPQKLED